MITVMKAGRASEMSSKSTSLIELSMSTPTSTRAPVVAAEAPLARLVAWLLLGRLFMGGLVPTQRDADEILDHAATELADTTAEIGVRKAALNALYKFMELGPAEEARGERLLQQLGL